MPTPPLRAARSAALALTLTLTLTACSMDSADPPPAEPAGSPAPSGDTGPGGGAAPASETAVIGAVTWQTDYPTAVALAVAADKPLWVHFGEDPG